MEKPTGIESDKIIIALLLVIIFMLSYIIFFKDTSNSTNDISENKEKASEIHVTDVPVKEQVNPYKNANLSVELIDSEGNTFGYKILLNGTPISNSATKIK